MDWSFEGDGTQTTHQVGRSNASTRETSRDEPIGPYDDSGRGSDARSPGVGDVDQKGSETMGTKQSSGAGHRAQPIMDGPGRAPAPAGSGAGLGVSMVMASNILGAIIANQKVMNVTMEEAIALSVETTAKLEAAMMNAAGVEAPPPAPEPRVKVKVGARVLWMTESEAASSGGEILPDRRG